MARQSTVKPRKSAESEGLPRLVVGISGASGAIYGIRLLKALKALAVETHLIISRAAELTIAYETDLKVPEVRALADATYGINDLGAPIASGSFQTLGMVIAPCSIKTMGEIATGVTANLLSRAADVTLKERRRLVLALRETPLHTGHLRSLLALSEMGAIVAPPVPAFYARPATIEAMVDHTVGRLADLFGLETGAVKRWQGPPLGRRRRPLED